MTETQESLLRFERKNPASDSTISDFRHLAQRYGHCLARQGIVRAHLLDEGSRLQNVDVAKLTQVNRHLTLLVQSLENELTRPEPAGVIDFRALWSFIKNVGLRPPTDLFGHLGREQTIEIYGLDFIQIYRNLRFMELCTYSLEEVLTEPFDDLFGREPAECETDIFSAINDILTGRLNQPSPFRLRRHVTFEKRSSSLRRFEAEGGIISPLFDSDGATAAFLVTLNAQSI